MECNQIVLLAAMILISSVSAEEASYISSDEGLKLAHDCGNVSSFNESLNLKVAIAAGPEYEGASLPSQVPIAQFSKMVQDRVEPEDPIVNRLANDLTLRFGGVYTIQQVASIHEYVANRWKYKPDPRGIDLPRYANDSIGYDQLNMSGYGDCDDFAIAISSLIENIGGASRIILAQGFDSGHAYAEVYVGKVGTNDFQRIDRWLREQYEDVYYHINDTTDEAWLNLDWGDDPTYNKLGDKFFIADSNTPVYIKPEYGLIPLRAVNEPPKAAITCSSQSAIAGRASITFNAGNTTDQDNNVIKYEWDFGDNSANQTASGLMVEHTFAKGGDFKVSLNVTDSEGAVGTTSVGISVNSPPVADFDVEPEHPLVGETALFKSISSDEEDTLLSNCTWQFPDGSKNGCSVKWELSQRGNNTVILCVKDCQGTISQISKDILVNEPPEAHFAVVSPGTRKPNAGETITFDGSSSQDLDGIWRWEWRFDDSTNPEYGERVEHKFSSGGNHTVKLRVEDIYNASDEYSEEININWPPVPVISFERTGNLVKFNGLQSFDPEGGTLKYNWDFENDGIIDNALPTPDKQYLSSGDYTVELTVIDENSASNSSTIIITLEPSNSQFLVYQDAPSTAYEEAPQDSSGIMYIVKDDGSIGELINITIGAAVAMADNDDTIYIEPGFYREEIFIDKDVNLVFTTGSIHIEDFQYFNELGSRTSIVGDDAFAEFTTINEAISSASDGDTIYIKPGSYNEDIFIDKIIKLTRLTGELGPIILKCNITIIAESENLAQIESASNVEQYQQDSTATIISQSMRGYQIFLDGIYIGTEGTGGDPLDGRFTFRVIGNQIHEVKVSDGQLNYQNVMFFEIDGTKIINVEPGTPVYA